MLIIWGSKLYGKVDVVPGFYHVATKFGHLWYIPLIPMESYLVLAQDGSHFRGLKIPMSGKSVVLAWLRAGLLVGGLLAGVLAIALLADTTPAAGLVPMVGAVLMLGLSALLSYHRIFVRAGYPRACQLGQLIGLAPQGQTMLDELYGYKDGVHDPFAGSRPHDPFADLKDERVF